MARNIAPLGVAELARITKPGRHAAGNGLYLELTDAGNRAWLLRCTIAGRPTWLGIGKVDPARWGASLLEARQRAQEARDAIAAGDDPRAIKRPSAANGGATGRVTFAAATEAYLNAHTADWSNDTHAQQWRDTVEHYGRSIWHKPVAAITFADVKACFAQDWRRVPDTAQRSLARMRRVFDLATAEGWRQAGNPADLGPIKQALGAVARDEERHHPAMPWKALPAFMRKLKAVRGDDAETADALRFLILTGSRTQEARDVAESEIDYAKKLWTVPAKRMKRRRAHRVPLSDQALAILEDTPRVREGRVFPTVGRTDMYGLLRKLGETEASVHGFRSSFDDWATDNKIADGLVIDAALAHRPRGKTTRAYRRTDHLEARVPLMEAWGLFLS